MTSICIYINKLQYFFRLIHIFISAIFDFSFLLFTDENTFFYATLGHDNVTFRTNYFTFRCTISVNCTRYFIVDIGSEIIRIVFKRNIDSNIQNLSPRDIAMWKVYVDLIRKAQEAGEMSIKMDAESTVEAIIYLVNGIGITWCNKMGDFDYVNECRRMIEFIL